MVEFPVLQTDFGTKSRSRSASVPLARILADLLLSAAFFVCLAVSYRYLTLYLGYQHFEYLPNPYRLPIIAVLLIAYAAIMPGKKTMQGFAMTLFVYSLWLPLLVWFGFGGATPKHLAITGLVMVLLHLICFIRIRRPVLQPISPVWIVGFTIAFGSLLVLWALAVNGIASVNFLIYEVYLFRRDAAENLPPIFQYLWPQVTNAMVPLAVAICLAEKRKIGFILLCGIAIFLFATVHHKGILFTPFLAALVYFLFHLREDLMLFKLAFVVMAAIGAIEAVIVQMEYVADIAPFNLLFSRRVLLVPAQLDALYLEFFSENAKYYWSQSRITFGLMSMPYDDTAPRVIGEVYFGRHGISSNTGFIGAGFANAGLLAVIVYVAILGAALCLLEAHAKALGHTLVITASILIIHNALTASDTVTLILTGGFGTLLLFFSFLKRRI